MISCHASLGVCSGSRPSPCGELCSDMVLFRVRFSWQFRRFRPSPQLTLSTRFGPLTCSEGQAFTLPERFSRIPTLLAQTRDFYAIRNHVISRAVGQRPALPHTHTESYSHWICRPLLDSLANPTHYRLTLIGPCPSSILFLFASFPPSFLFGSLSNLYLRSAHFIFNPMISNPHSSEHISVLLAFRKQW
ncbi:hypothetical protein PAXRUDRAFT_640009 [Paxillus rubicundulus Ve08.2h10]|uniref:Uncharacterized protein n=1 Tax=Paxillus rubicundulus Ve08.2h10 TaxID=930991 RepID=A0A0D0DXR2_9AGAM|nr:hypothetical protein PAXRUDRAFT_640009 [Paxillus rubicundulus Ve08.2h10]